jgi:hypothetical protein
MPVWAWVLGAVAIWLLLLMILLLIVRRRGRREKGALRDARRTHGPGPMASGGSPRHSPR